MPMSAELIERGRRASLILRKLAVAYGARMAAGDSVHASIALGEFVRIYNSTFPVLREWVANGASTVSAGTSLPSPPLQARYDDRTRAALARALVWPTAVGAPPRTAEYEVLNRGLWPTSAAGVGAWFTGQMQPVLSEADFDLARSQTLTTADPGAAGTALQQMSDRFIMTGGAPELTLSEGEETAFDAPPEDIITLPPASISPTRWVMPTWGWWALGLGVVAGGGYLVYRFGESEGWYG